MVSPGIWEYLQTVRNEEPIDGSLVPGAQQAQNSIFITRQSG
jgi:hypothetical protein